VLSHISHHRFEFGIGAGDRRQSFEAWGERYPPWVRSSGRASLSRWPAIMCGCTGLSALPRRSGHRVSCSVWVGRAGRYQRAAGSADELNVYDTPGLIEEALDLARRSPRSLTVSVFADWSWNSWPLDPLAVLGAWSDRGVERCFVSVGGLDTIDRICT